MARRSIFNLLVYIPWEFYYFVEMYRLMKKWHSSHIKIGWLRKFILISHFLEELKHWFLSSYLKCLLLLISLFRRWWNSLNSLLNILKKVRWRWRGSRKSKKLMKWVHRVLTYRLFFCLLKVNMRLEPCQAWKRNCSFFSQWIIILLLY